MMLPAAAQRLSLPMRYCPRAVGTHVCPATSMQTLAVSEDGSWVAGLGRNGHGQQILLLWEVHGLQRTCKVHCVSRYCAQEWRQQHAGL